MINKIYRRFVLSLFLLISIFTVSLPQTAMAQTVAPAQVSGDLQVRLQTIEEKLEAKRKELGIPGLSMVVVKDDQIIYLKGLGHKDFEKQIAVTPDTQFAIGSSSKAFTALSVLMSQDEGRLSIDDNPKKYLPYFKINDAEIDSKITIRDLLSHSSGLNRTDLTWITGKLSREEIIRVAGEAKPTAKLGEKFQYQNVMFAAAGEIVAQVNKTPWEKFVADRIFKPLGMTNSNLSIPAMQRSKDYSFGYEYNSDTKETRRLPFRDFPTMTPAGAINSSARDMAQWLRFMLGGGSAGGKRLISETAFAELTKPQMKIAGKTSYGLGWFVQEWNGLKVVQHGGNIDGFNALVAMVPEKKLGFVILTNVSGSPLPAQMMSVVWENLLGSSQAATTAATATIKPEMEVGKYNFKEANFDIEVKMQDGKLVAQAPGQPLMTLENVGGRRYKLMHDGKTMDGYFLTFRETDAYIEQPQGNYALPKAKAAAVQLVENVASPAGAAKELIGSYETEKQAGLTVEILEKDSKIWLIVPGQQPYELREKAKDVYSAPPLPDDFSVKASRDVAGSVTGIVLVQPNGEVPFKRAGKTAANAPQMTIGELMPKVITALGGEAVWKKQNSRIVKFELDFVHQGVKGNGVQYAKAPNYTASKLTFTALGKPIGTMFDYFNGTEGGEEVSFAPAEKYAGKQLEDARIGAAFYGLLDWKTNYKKAEVKGAAKVGGEDAYVVVFEPEKGNKDTIYFSQKTFLPLRLESVSSSSTSGVSSPYSEIYTDYRAVDGVMIPFKTVNSSTGSGDVVTVLKEVKHNAAIDDKVFRLRKN